MHDLSFLVGFSEIDVQGVSFLEEEQVFWEGDSWRLLNVFFL